jgi:4-amino-4-deoxy-L-arabinose transferase-like glycosyltransferase
MKRDDTPVRSGEYVALVVLLLLAAVLRLGAPGITEFKRDEANLSQRALDLVHGRDFPLLGLSSSVGVPNPPISVYLFAVPYALDSSPIAATIFVGLLNVIAVALTWWLARRYYGWRAAAVAGLLYAVSPWGILYSRKIWAQDLLPPFVLATVLTGLLGFGEGKRWARWAHWPLLALTVQIHYAAFILIPLSLLMLVLWHAQIRWRELAFGLGLAALTVIPAVIGATQDHLLSLDTVRHGLNANAGHQRVISTTALDYAWFTVAGTDLHSLAGPEQFQQYLDSVPDAYPLFKLVPLGAALAAAWLVGRAIGRRKVYRTPDVVLVAWLVLPVLAFTWEWTEVAPHYLLPLMPAAYLLCGVGINAVWQSVRLPQIRRLLLAGGGILLAVIAGLQITLYVKLLHFLDQHATPGGFGTPLHDLLNVRDAVLERQPQDVIVISTGELAPYDEVPAVWGVLLDRVPSVRFVNGTRTVVIPAGDSLELIAWSPALRVCADQDCLNRGGIEVFNLRPGENPYIVRRVQDTTPKASLSPIEPVRFANGAYLTGYAVNPGSVVLAWRLDGPVGEDYHAFVHALDAGGQRLAQSDRLAWPGRYWRAGDTLVLWFDLTVPPDAATLYTGMYTTDGTSFNNVDVLDASGAYLAQGATIPLGG